MSLPYVLPTLLLTLEPPLRSLTDVVPRMGRRGEGTPPYDGCYFVAAFLQKHIEGKADLE
jgi:hypothetical protein